MNKAMGKKCPVHNSEKCYCDERKDFFDTDKDELMEEIRDAINVVVGGMVTGQIRSFKATIALSVLFRTFLENPNYKDKSPEKIVMDIITSK